MDKFYLRLEGAKEWTEVTKEFYLKVEKNAGFYSKFDNHPATSFFSNDRIQGRCDVEELEI